MQEPCSITIMGVLGDRSCPATYVPYRGHTCCSCSAKQSGKQLLLVATAMLGAGE